MIDETIKQLTVDNLNYHNKSGLYIRVSTLDQVKTGFSLPEQEERLRALCTYKGYEVVDIYTDSGISAKDTNRPEYQRMMNDVKIGKINRIVALKLDRVTRSIMDLEKMVTYLEENDCSLECAYEEINTSNANGRFFVRMLTILAQLELERTSERTYIGLDGAMKAKHFPGKTPLGYKKIDKVLHIDESTAPIIARIFNQYINGISACAIAKLFTEEKVLDRSWGSTTIDNILNNRIYVGEFIYRKTVADKEKEIIEKMAPPIISREIWEKSQETKKINLSSHQLRNDYLFKKKLYCDECNHLLASTCGTSKTGEKHLYYKCCHCKKIFNEKTFEKNFIDKVNDVLDYFSVVDNNFLVVSLRDYTFEINETKNKINEIINQEENAKKMLLKNEIILDQFNNTLKTLAQEKIDLKNRLSDLLTRNKDVTALNNNNYYRKINKSDKLLSLYTSLKQSWFELDRKQKIELIIKYIDKIQISLKDDVQIKKIIIKENMIMNFALEFRKDIFNYLYDDETIESIAKENFKDTIANVSQYYKLESKEISGKRLFNNAETNNILVTST